MRVNNCLYLNGGVKQEAQTNLQSGVKPSNLFFCVLKLQAKFQNLGVRGEEERERKKNVLNSGHYILAATPKDSTCASQT